MKSGGFPGQRAALAARVEQVRREGRRLATRRMFLGALVGGAAGLAGGALSVHGLTAHVAGPRRERGVASRAEEREAHALATGPLQALVAQRGRFLMVLRGIAAPDEVSWFGVERLANAALRGSVPEHDKVRRALLAFAGIRPDAPPHVRAWYAALRRRGKNRGGSK